jgi:hypothetical protein
MLFIYNINGVVTMVILLTVLLSVIKISELFRLSIYTALQ